MRFSGSPVTFIQSASASSSPCSTEGHSRLSSSPQPPSACDLVTRSQAYSMAPSLK